VCPTETTNSCSGGQCRCGTGPACGAGQHCVLGSCQCTPSSCPNGCCDPLRDACVAENDLCANNFLCLGGQCQCTGCVSAGGDCRPGNSGMECGKNGVQCNDCGGNPCVNGECQG
jgi:hypothetical protein